MLESIFNSFQKPFDYCANSDENTSLSYAISNLALFYIYFCKFIYIYIYKTYSFYTAC